MDGAFANRIDRTILLRLPTQEHKYLFFKQYLEKEGIDTTVTKEEFKSIETDRFSYRDLDSWFKAAIDDGPYLRDEDSQHYKYVSQQNRSDYLIVRNAFLNQVFKRYWIQDRCIPPPYMKKIFFADLDDLRL